MFFYDAKGRLARIEVGDFQKSRERAEIQLCRRYDTADRLVLKLNPIVTQSCTVIEPDVRDDWVRYAYEEYAGVPVKLLEEWHHGTQGCWSKKFNLVRAGPKPEDVWGAAEANSGSGVTTIYGSVTVSSTTIRRILSWTLLDAGPARRIFSLVRQFHWTS